MVYLAEGSRRIEVPRQRVTADTGNDEEHGGLVES